MADKPQCSHLQVNVMHPSGFFYDRIIESATGGGGQNQPVRDIIWFHQFFSVK